MEEAARIRRSMEASSSWQRNGNGDKPSPPDAAGPAGYGRVPGSAFQRTLWWQGGEGGSCQATMGADPQGCLALQL